VSAASQFRWRAWIIHQTSITWGWNTDGGGKLLQFFRASRGFSSSSHPRAAFTWWVSGGFNVCHGTRSRPGREKMKGEKRSTLPG